MTEENFFPGYVSREEESAIRAEVAEVAVGHESRAVLLYGPGGIGKTWLVRALAGAHRADKATAWLEPVDVDDPEYWLLSNLEQKVAEQLDPGAKYFGPYIRYLSRLPSYSRTRIGHETVVSHLGRIKRVFVDCYAEYIQATGKTVVMAFDTVEAIRGVYLLYTLTQWMKALPGTLFILSGRPLPGTGDPLDPIKSELEDPYQRIPVQTMMLGEFTHQDAESYLAASGVCSAFSDDQAEALVLLTRGHPLWLAFTISYVSARGIPEEALTDLEAIRRDIPYRGPMSHEGRMLHEAFKRRLVTPYRDVDFWHEAVKRLAVVRQSVNQGIWQRLMSDRGLPDDASDLDDAWEMLKRTPWIRTRANRRYVTLHDAVAEELAHRIIPLHDRSQLWRRELWSRAAEIYTSLTAEPEAEVAGQLADADDRLRRINERLRATAGQELQEAEPDPEESALIAEVARLDARKREIDQAKAVAFYYHLLSDFRAGAARFLDLFARAQRGSEVFLQDRLALEMQRFLPGAVHPYALDDIVGGAIAGFQRWLSADGREMYLRIGMRVAGYLIDNEQPQGALALLGRLPSDAALHGQRSRLSILKGNACIRIPGKVADGLPYFEQALSDAIALDEPERGKAVADAYKELGFYYRNGGLWRKADEAYRMARDVISVNLAGGGAEAEHENMASIQTNWAYLKGLNGDYRDGSSLVRSAIAVRHRLGLNHQEGISWSVAGEIYRYERRFTKAWDAFAVAERIFQGQRNWSWLGTIYQQQAICIYQAIKDGINLVPDKDADEQAKMLITLALDICRDQNIRGYPSALNRAGRIFGQENFELGMRYLEEGIEQARKLSDGWFWFANLIEYAELNYRAWAQTGDPQYRQGIADCAEAVGLASAEYEFKDLEGRWRLVQGHLGVHDWAESGDRVALTAALESYTIGFAQLAQGYVGSSGAVAVAGEFEIFERLFSRLAAADREHWLEELRLAWSALGQGSILLLAHLEPLYY